QDYSYKQSIDYINNLHSKGSVKKLYSVMNGVEVNQGYGGYGSYGSYGYGNYGYGSYGYHEDEKEAVSWWRRMLRVLLLNCMIVGSLDWGIVGSLGRYYVVNIDPTVVAVRPCEERYTNLGISPVLMRSVAIP